MGIIVKYLAADEKELNLLRERMSLLNKCFELKSDEDLTHTACVLVVGHPAEQNSTFIQIQPFTKTSLVEVIEKQTDLTASLKWATPDGVDIEIRDLYFRIRYKSAQHF